MIIIRDLPQVCLCKNILKEGLVAICDVDTRALVRYVRDKGAMNAIISSDNSDIESLKAQLAKVLVRKV